MSTSRCMRAPWSVFRRLKVHEPLVQQTQQRAAISTAPAPRKEEQATQNEEGAQDESVEQKNTSYTLPPRGQPLFKNRPQDDITRSLLEIAAFRNITPPPSLQQPPASGAPRLPRSVQALYLQPLRRTPTHGIPVANLQLRSYSVRNLEFMADFALRAAYYLNLPAKGPVPLPRITERWTVPRSNFIFKKSQENWERITVRRLVQVLDGHPEAVRTWLAFVKKWCWYGVGMKADVFEFEGVGTGKTMDSSDEAVRRGVEKVEWELFGRRKGLGSREEVGREMERRGFAGVDVGAPGTGAQMPRSGARSL